MNHELEGIWKKVFMACIEVIPSIRVRKSSTKFRSRDLLNAKGT
jgi:hypothetical protein